MTLGELREKIKNLPDDLEIRIQLKENDGKISINIPVLNVRQVKTGRHGKIKEIIMCSKSRW